MEANQAINAKLVIDQLQNPKPEHVHVTAQKLCMNF